MDERKHRIQQIVESFPGGMTTEVNRQDMKCWVQSRGFAHWLEEGLPVDQPQLLVKTTEEVQVALVLERPDRYHAPTQKTWKKWLGIRLDVAELDWIDIERRLTDAYCATAPRTLVKELNHSLK